MFDEVKFKEIVEEAVLSAMAKVNPVQQVPTVEAQDDEYIYSIRGLASFLNCSVMTAQKLKNQGLIPYLQLNRKVIFEKSKVLKAMQKGGRK